MSSSPRTLVFYCVCEYVHSCPVGPDIVKFVCLQWYWRSDARSTGCSCLFLRWIRHWYNPYSCGFHPCNCWLFQVYCRIYHDIYWSNWPMLKQSFPMYIYVWWTRAFRCLCCSQIHNCGWPWPGACTALLWSEIYICERLRTQVYYLCDGCSSLTNYQPDVVVEMLVPTG